MVAFPDARILKISAAAPKTLKPTEPTYKVLASKQ
jgi:hypothetical protein